MLIRKPSLPPLHDIVYSGENLDETDDNDNTSTLIERLLSHHGPLYSDIELQD